MNEAGVLFAEGYVFQVGVELIVVINSNFPHQKWDSHLEKSIL